MATTRPSLERQRNSEIADFLNGFTWARIYDLWRKRLSEFAVPAFPLFKIAEIQVPVELADRQPDLVWWPRATFNEELRKCQEHFDRYPRTAGPTHPSGFQYQGELQTLMFLHPHKDHPEKVAAILICASLVARLQRGYYPDNWPKRWLGAAFQALAYAAWQEGDERWHHACSRVIPYQSEDYYYALNSLPALIYYLAEEHAALLHTYTPTVVVFVSSRSPMLRGI